ncbi:hypothetical protein [Hahella ganghwensis]|uniref:hypothetical protein n=1 Tax=Hahella ganghwensis TaxID=286420 RepID=UPI00037D35A4|nr:hypothetical protein [Hahella ganghwensis]
MTICLPPQDPDRTQKTTPISSNSTDSYLLYDTKVRGSIGNTLLMPLSCTGYVALTLPTDTAYRDTTWFLVFAALMFLVGSIYAVASRRAFYPDTDMVMITTTGLLASLIALLGAWNHASLIPLLILYLFWVYNLSGLALQTAGFLSLIAIVLGLGIGAMYHGDIIDIVSDAVITLTANWMAVLTVKHNQEQLENHLRFIKQGTARSSDHPPSYPRDIEGSG